jgi:isopentenyl-diphosphate delta-isomerase
MTSEDQVILVDEFDNEIGRAGKLQAHIDGLLHRAFSIFLFNESGEMLLQRRSLVKYHSAGLWTNACCSHPRPGETTEHAAVRRLHEEMGLYSELTPMYTFKYRSEVGRGLVEHELDHVFIGITNAIPNPNADEVMAYRYITINDLIREVAIAPAEYTAWFKITLDSLLYHRQKLQLS